MASKIEWTTETWNPVTGCTKVSAGCTHCYAESMAKRFWKGRKFTEVRCHLDRMGIPLKRRKPTTFFVCSMGDLFHDKVPDWFILNVFNVMASATLECNRRHEHEPECWTGDPHMFIVPTKRPERAYEWLMDRVPVLLEDWGGDECLPMAMECGNWPLRNVILGVSVEDQPTFDERVPWLLKTPAACRMISMEPMLGSIECGDKLEGIDWVILGGESGPGARRMIVEWAFDVRDECKAAGIPLFFKQYGTLLAKQWGLTASKGQDPAEWLHKWPRRFPPLLKGKTNDK